MKPKEIQIEQLPGRPEQKEGSTDIHNSDFPQVQCTMDASGK